MARVACLLLITGLSRVESAPPLSPPTPPPSPPSPPRSPDVYALVNSGSCADAGYFDIDSQSECFLTAFEELSFHGVVTGVPAATSGLTTRASYCLIWDGKLYYNPLQTYCASNEPCVCRTVPYPPPPPPKVVDVNGSFHPVDDDGRLVLSCACKDPHLTLAYGGGADFRGFPGKIHSLVTSQDTAVNARIDESLFRLRSATINGTFFTAIYVVASGTDGERLLFTIDASRLNELNYAWNFVTGTCNKREFVLGPHGSTDCGELHIHLTYVSVFITTRDWQMVVTGKPVYDRLTGPHHRLDVSFANRETTCGHHGLIGQSYDGSGVGRVGKSDVYPKSGNFTTTAMAEGAIAGRGEDYVVATPYSTEFPFSSFGSCAPVVARRLEEPSPLDTNQCCERCFAAAWDHCNRPPTLPPPTPPPPSSPPPLLPPPPLPPPLLPPTYYERTDGPWHCDNLVTQSGLSLPVTSTGTFYLEIVHRHSSADVDVDGHIARLSGSGNYWDFRNLREGYQVRLQGDIEFSTGYSLEVPFTERDDIVVLRLQYSSSEMKVFINNVESFSGSVTDFDFTLDTLYLPYSNQNSCTTSPSETSSFRYDWTPF